MVSYTQLQLPARHIHRLKEEQKELFAGMIPCYIKKQPTKKMLEKMILSLAGFEPAA
jgi:hypothetical protein